VSVFELDPVGQRAVDQEAQSNGVDVANLPPGFWDGAATGIGHGVMRGGARAGQFIGMAAAAPVVLFDKAAGTDYADDVFSALDSTVNNAVDYWTPSANELGTAGRVLGGLSEIALPLMAGGGNPALLIGSQEMGTATDLIRQGADAKAAIGAGIAQGAATAVGFKIPFLGNTFLSRSASGAVGNLATNAASAAVTNRILSSTGREDLAQQYNPFDVESRLVDILTGIAFGGIAHIGARVSTRDAAIAASNAKHFQQDTAPGVPADSVSAMAHQNAMEVAMRDLLEGKPVEVGNTNIEGAEFLRKPGELSDIPADPNLKLDDALTEARFKEQIQSDVDGAIEAYSRLPDSEGGKVLNTDIARELSPEYAADRTKSAAVHEPASALVKAMFARKLKEEPGQGEDPLVVFSAGGTGAGKTTGLDAAGIGARAQIVYDSNMNSLESSVRRIDQALDAGKQVQILYTFRDPVEALTGGALPRAMRQEKQLGSGRTVPVSEHAKTHIGAAKVVRQLAEKYADDPRVNVMAVDNSRSKGNARVSSLDLVPELDLAHNELVGKLNEALEQQREAGKISDSVFRGFAGEKAVQPEGIRERTGTGSSETPQRGGQEQPLDFSVAAANQALAGQDFQIPTGEIDVDGTPRMASARELMAKAEADVAQAKNDAKAFDAAAACFLSAGL
jgi:hypothetical protein